MDTTPELATRLRACIGTSQGDAVINEAADALEAQARDLAAMTARAEKLATSLVECGLLTRKSTEELIAAEARALAAERDASLYKWLKEHAMLISCADDDSEAGNFALGEEDDDMDKLDDTIRAAIDAAGRK